MGLSYVESYWTDGEREEIGYRIWIVDSLCQKNILSLDRERVSPADPVPENIKQAACLKTAGNTIMI